LARARSIVGVLPASVPAGEVARRTARHLSARHAPPVHSGLRRGHDLAVHLDLGEFLFAVTLTGPEYWPVTVALQNLAGSQVVEWNVQMAGALIAALPTLAMYIPLGRFLLRGLMAGALKG
jgi:hypothetical protein